MKKNIFNWKFMIVLSLVLIFTAVGLQDHVFSFFQEQGETLYQDLKDLAGDTDLYCSFFVLDSDRPELKIIGAERQEEKEMLSNGDIVYFNAGESDGLSPGDIFLVFEVKDSVEGFGPLGQKKARARVIHVAESKASAQIEKACLDVRIGDYVVEFDEKEGFVGKNLGFAVSPFENRGPKGNIVYLQTEFAQLGPGQWALIDMGRIHGVEFGQQLLVYREVVKDAPLQIFGNVLVIDVQSGTSTIKILGCKDSIRLGDKVMFRSE